MPLTKNIGRVWNPQSRNLANQIEKNVEGLIQKNNQDSNSEQEHVVQKEQSKKHGKKYGLNMSSNKVDKEENDFQIVKKKLNGLKQQSVFLSALISHPRLSSSPEKLSQAMDVINSLYKESADRAVQEILGENINGKGKEFQIRNAMAYFLSDLWKDYTSPDEELSPEFLVDNFVRAYKQSEMLPETIFEENGLDSDVDLKLAKGRAINKFYPTLMKVDKLGKASCFFWGDTDFVGSLKNLSNDLQERNSRILNALLGDDYDLQKKEDRIAFKSILNSLSWDYKSALEVEYNRLGQKLYSMEKEDKIKLYQDLKNNDKEGLLLSNVKKQMDSVEKSFVFVIGDSNKNEKKEEAEDNVKPEN